MRIMEIANAEEQLALLRLIMNKTWDAVAVQAEQQKRADAERKAQAKLKPRSRKPTTIPKAPSPPPPPPLKKPKPPLTKQPTTTPNLTNPNKSKTITPVRSPVKAVPTIQPQANPALKPLPNTVPTYQQNTPKDGYLDRNIGVIKKDGDGDDRHSKNGIRNPKKLPRNFQHPST